MAGACRNCREIFDDKRLFPARGVGIKGLLGFQEGPRTAAGRCTGTQVRHGASPGAGKKFGTPSIRIDRLGMTDSALRTMKEITSTYVEDGYPNYRVWWFRLREDDTAFSELTALGLIEPIGIWRSFKLTREGLYWALENREIGGSLQLGSAF